ncbi:MAG: ABC transporter substrate-binding protein, partial [Bdellovibrionales bacterium]|nr:ABC transporter substrate-binding protein [Bdellovibrionales bacterium]
MPRSTLVSLVPSITELLFDLGLGERLLAVTDWCVHPNTKVKGLPKIGGTKNPRIADVADLRPDLVIANKEENRRIDIERIARREINVWVTEVRTLTEASRLVSELVESFDVDR